MATQDFEQHRGPDRPFSRGFLDTPPAKSGFEHNTSGAVQTVVQEAGRRTRGLGSLQDMPEVRRALNGNGHSRGKSGEIGFSSIVSDKPLEETDRISDEDLFMSLHQLKEVYRESGISPKIRREAFQSIIDKAKQGLIGKGYPGYIEGLANCCRQAKQATGRI